MLYFEGGKKERLISMELSQRHAFGHSEIKF
jgi:hypothetical protein